MLPDDYSSHDHLNEQVEISVDPDTKAEWKSRLQQEGITWVIVDGFVLYWDEVSAPDLAFTDDRPSQRTSTSNYC